MHVCIFVGCSHIRAIGAFTSSMRTAGLLHLLSLCYVLHSSPSLIPSVRAIITQLVGSLVFNHFVYIRYGFCQDVYIYTSLTLSISLYFSVHFSLSIYIYIFLFLLYMYTYNIFVLDFPQFRISRNGEKQRLSGFVLPHASCICCLPAPI